MKKTTIAERPFNVLCDNTQEEPRPDWLLMRKSGVCTTDFYKLLGIDGSPMDVFDEKNSPVATEEKLTLKELFRIMFGNALESVLHTIMAQHLNADAIFDKRMYQSTITPYMLANIDGLFRLRMDTVIQGVFFPAGTLLLYEGKTTNRFLYQQSRKAPLPRHVAQCKAGMITRGVDAAILVVCCGNDLEKDVVYHLIQLTQEDRVTIPLIIDDFWTNHMLTGKAPGFAAGEAASQMKASLLRHYAQNLKVSDAEILQLPRNTEAIIKKALKARSELSDIEAMAKTVRANRDEYDLLLMDLLKDQYAKGILDCGPYTYSLGYQNTGKQEDITSSNMKRLKQEMPDVYRKLVESGIITRPGAKMFYVRQQRRQLEVQKGRKKRTA